MIATKSRKTIPRDSRTIHKELLERLVQNGLYRGLFAFRLNPQPKLLNCWPELHLTDRGVLEENVYVRGEYACPDLILRTSRPGLVIVELKTRSSLAALDRLEYQLKTDHTYVQEHGGELAEFLEQEGLSPEEIGDLEISFSGVVGVGGRKIKEVKHFELFGRQN